MGDIYKNCLVNISAHFWENCHGGCFNSRSQNQFDFPIPERRVISSKVKSGQDSRLVIYSDEGLRQELPRRSLRRISRFNFLQWNREVAGGYLYNRAWVCQERWLSPRILHYTEGQIFWECKHCVLAEDGLPVFDSEFDTERDFRELLRNPTTNTRVPHWTWWYVGVVRPYHAGLTNLWQSPD